MTGVLKRWVIMDNILLFPARNAIQNTVQMIREPHSETGSLDTRTVSILRSSMEDVLIEDALVRDVPAIWSEAKKQADRFYEEQRQSTLHRGQNAGSRTNQRAGPGLQTSSIPSLLSSPQASLTPSTGVAKRTETDGFNRGRSVSC
jgi:hypothetical protein